MSTIAQLLAWHEQHSSTDLPPEAVQKAEALFSAAVHAAPLQLLVVLLQDTGTDNSSTSLLCLLLQLLAPHHPLQRDIFAILTEIEQMPAAYVFTQFAKRATPAMLQPLLRRLLQKMVSSNSSSHVAVGAALALSTLLDTRTMMDEPVNDLLFEQQCLQQLLQGMGSNDSIITDVACRVTVCIWHQYTARWEGQFDAAFTAATQQAVDQLQQDDAGRSKTAAALFCYMVATSERPHDFLLPHAHALVEAAWPQQQQQLPVGQEGEESQQQQHTDLFEVQVVALAALCRIVVPEDGFLDNEEQQEQLQQLQQQLPPVLWLWLMGDGQQQQPAAAAAAAGGGGVHLQALSLFRNLVQTVQHGKQPFADAAFDAVTTAIDQAPEALYLPLLLADQEWAVQMLLQLLRTDDDPADLPMYRNIEFVQKLFETITTTAPPQLLEQLVATLLQELLSCSSSSSSSSSSNQAAAAAVKGFQWLLEPWLYGRTFSEALPGVLARQNLQLMLQVDLKDPEVQTKLGAKPASVRCLVAGVFKLLVLSGAPAALDKVSALLHDVVQCMLQGNSAAAALLFLMCSDIPGSRKSGETLLMQLKQYTAELVALVQQQQQQQQQHGAGLGQQHGEHHFQCCQMFAYALLCALAEKAELQAQSDRRLLQTLLIVRGSRATSALAAAKAAATKTEAEAAAAKAAASMPDEQSWLKALMLAAAAEPPYDAAAAAADAAGFPLQQAALISLTRIAADTPGPLLTALTPSELLQLLTAIRISDKGYGEHANKLWHRLLAAPDGQLAQKLLPLLLQNLQATGSSSSSCQGQTEAAAAAAAAAQALHYIAAQHRITSGEAEGAEAMLSVLLQPQHVQLLLQLLCAPIDGGSESPAAVAAAAAAAALRMLFKDEQCQPSDGAVEVLQQLMDRALQGGSVSAGHFLAELFRSRRQARFWMLNHTDLVVNAARPGCPFPKVALTLLQSMVECDRVAPMAIAAQDFAFLLDYLQHGSAAAAAAAGDAGGAGAGAGGDDQAGSSGSNGGGNAGGDQCYDTVMPAAVILSKVVLHPAGRTRLSDWAKIERILQAAVPPPLAPVAAAPAAAGETAVPSPLAPVDAAAAAAAAGETAALDARQLKSSFDQVEKVEGVCCAALRTVLWLLQQSHQAGPAAFGPVLEAVLMHLDYPLAAMQQCQMPAVSKQAGSLLLWLAGHPQGVSQLSQERHVSSLVQVLQLQQGPVVLAAAKVLARVAANSAGCLLLATRRRFEVLLAAVSKCIELHNEDDTAVALEIDSEGDAAVAMEVVQAIRHCVTAACSPRAIRSPGWRSQQPQALLKPCHVKQLVAAAQVPALAAAAVAALRPLVTCDAYKLMLSPYRLLLQQAAQQMHALAEKKAAGQAKAAAAAAASTVQRTVYYINDTVGKSVGMAVGNVDQAWRSFQEAANYCATVFAAYRTTRAEVDSALAALLQEANAGAQQEQRQQHHGEACASRSADAAAAPPPAAAAVQAGGVCSSCDAPAQKRFKQSVGLHHTHSQKHDAVLQQQQQQMHAGPQQQQQQFEQRKQVLLQQLQQQHALVEAAVDALGERGTVYNELQQQLSDAGVIITAIGQSP